jgi:hypothetical protein
MALIGFGDDFVRHEFAAIRLGKAFADGGPRLVIDRKSRGIADHCEESARELILLFVGQLAHTRYRLFQQLCHVLSIAGWSAQEK